MSERQQRMIDAFAEYERRDPATVGLRHSIIGMPLGTRLHRMIRVPNGWMLWLSTRDYIYGTYLLVYDSGTVERWTVREDEGDEVFTVRPSDQEIREMLDD